MLFDILKIIKNIFTNLILFLYLEYLNFLNVKWTWNMQLFFFIKYYIVFTFIKVILYKMKDFIAPLLIWWKWPHCLSNFRIDHYLYFNTLKHFWPILVQSKTSLFIFYEKGGRVQLSFWLATISFLMAYIRPLEIILWPKRQLN